MVRHLDPLVLKSVHLVDQLSLKNISIRASPLQEANTGLFSDPNCLAKRPAALLARSI
jgi:hypothetical protein